MSNHTRGPWHFSSDARIRTGVMGEGTNLSLADLRFASHAMSMRLSSEEQTANGRLMAAAPELLEACQRVLRAVEPLPGDRFYIGTWTEIREQLHTALEKAEGSNA